jgi:hypothetical protein
MNRGSVGMAWRDEIHAGGDYGSLWPRLLIWMRRFTDAPHLSHWQDFFFRCPGAQACSHAPLI